RHPHVLQPRFRPDRQRGRAGRRHPGRAPPRARAHAGLPAAHPRRPARRVPGTTFYFQPADIVTQVLDFGLPAPIDVEVEGPNLDRTAEVARVLRERIRLIPGVVDVRTPQMLTHPALQVEVDRERAAQVGITQRDVANSMLVSLSSSQLVSPSFWLSPENNVNYYVVAQTPLDRASSVDDILRTPLGPSGRPGADAPNGFAGAPGVAPTLAGIARMRPALSKAMVSHDNVQRIVDVQLGVEGRDLGAVSGDIDRVIAGIGKLPPATRIHVRGQIEAMRSSFASLGLGVILASGLVYLLLVVLFQSFLDPFIIILAVPGALVGVLVMLGLTGTTLNVESLMGT